MIKWLRQTGSYAGLLALVGYMSLALVAFSFYPGPFAPNRNWLSDLGNADVNPKGAIFYNLGIIFTGLFLLAFFLSFTQVKLKNHKIQNLMVGLTQLFGVLGSLSMVMSALYPINLLEQHRFWSVSLYVLLGSAFAFSVAALRYRFEFPRWVLVLGVITALCDIIWGIFQEVTLLEWITVGLFLGYVLVLSVKTLPVYGNKSWRVE
jgi:hypothetical membrane protein